ncbi:hypothetical protein B484DRAFT_420549 [Ochromonadaceae sp. CCMP2298]|nr:hypothetical protein B484DRAFT_420549 [Ochromonadaceae sp. CCMP2298]
MTAIVSLLRNSLAALILARLLLASSDPSQATTYSLDSDDIYTWNRGYPQSCECAVSGAKKTDCSLFRCLCTCDVTAAVCDFNCCCDPDCSTAQTERFNSLGACEYEGFESSTIQHCYSSSQLYGINPRSPLGGESTAQTAVGQALCVEEKNSQIAEDFFAEAPVINSAVFDTTAGQKSYSYTEDDEVTLSVDVNYDQNDSIAAFFDATAGFVSNGPGYMQLPQADFSGQCNDQNYVTFENPISTQTCNRVLSTNDTVFVAQCEQQFSMKRYVSDLYIASAADTEASLGTATIDDAVDVTVSAIYFEDYISGASTDITTAWVNASCVTTGYSGSPSLDSAGVTVSSCSFSDTDTLASLTSIYAALCTGFVKNVHYTVNHKTTAAGTISSVTAAVVLMDVPMSGNSTSVTVAQCFSVDFSSADSTAQSSTTGNLVERKRSGNPGYLLGMPVLYGALNSDSYIESLVDGMTVPTAMMGYDADLPATYGISACPQSAAKAGAQAVNFGYDLLSGCTAQLTRAQLEELCCTGSGSCTGSYSSEYSDASTGIPYMLNFTQQYVGNYGDASPLDVGQWTQIAYSAPTDLRAWSEATSTCSDMFSGLNIEFLVAFTGSRSNPQNKIVSSRAEIVTDDFKINIPIDDTVSTQAFPITITVSFVFRDENEIKGYVAPAPPVLFNVPYDVFAPFVSSAPPRPHVFKWVGVSVLLTLSAWLVM